MTPLLLVQLLNVKNQRKVNKSAYTSPHHSSHHAFGRVHVAEIFFLKTVHEFLGEVSM